MIILYDKSASLSSSLRLCRCDETREVLRAAENHADMKRYKTHGWIADDEINEVAIEARKPSTSTALEAMRRADVIKHAARRVRHR